MNRPYRVICDHSDGLRSALVSVGKHASGVLLKNLAVEIAVYVYKSKRTKEQNDMLHGICSEVSKQIQWAGQWIDTDGWKRLFVDTWCRESGERQGVIVPSLDGKSVVILNKSTAKMNVVDLQDLIEFCIAWASDRGCSVKYVDGKNK